MEDGGDTDRSKTGSGYPENQTALSFSDILFQGQRTQDGAVSVRCGLIPGWNRRK